MFKGMFSYYCTAHHFQPGVKTVRQLTINQMRVKLQSHLKIVSILCSLEGFVEAIRMVSVDLEAPLRLLSALSVIRCY